MKKKKMMGGTKRPRTRDLITAIIAKCNGPADVINNGTRKTTKKMTERLQQLITKT